MTTCFRPRKEKTRKEKKIKQHNKDTQLRKDFLSKFSVQRRGDIDSPNHWHWSSDAVFPLSHGNEMQEQWPPLPNIKSNVGSGTKDCDKPASKDNESSASKDGSKMNGVEAKCKEWSRVASKPKVGIAEVTDPTNLKTK